MVSNGGKLLYPYFMEKNYSGEVFPEEYLLEMDYIEFH